MSDTLLTSKKIQHFGTFGVFDDGEYVRIYKMVADTSEWNQIAFWGASHASLNLPISGRRDLTILGKSLIDLFERALRVGFDKGRKHKSKQIMDALKYP